MDGREAGHTDKNPSDCPSFILTSTEVNGYRNADRTPTEEARAAIGDTFLVDYVRVFDRK